SGFYRKGTSGCSEKASDGDWKDQIQFQGPCGIRLTYIPAQEKIFMSSDKVYWVTERSDDNTVTTHHLFSTKKLTDEMAAKELHNKLCELELCPFVRAMKQGRYVPYHRVNDALE